MPSQYPPCPCCLALLKPLPLQAQRLDDLTLCLYIPFSAAVLSTAKLLQTAGWLAAWAAEQTAASEAPTLPFSPNQQAGVQPQHLLCPGSFPITSFSAADQACPGGWKEEGALALPRDGSSEPRNSQQGVLILGEWAGCWLSLPDSKDAA